jgi:hypothetical protein
MAKLTDDQLLGLLWLVGEFAARSFPGRSGSYPGTRRQLTTLSAIAGFSKTPMTLQETRAHIREAVSQL